MFYIKVRPEYADSIDKIISACPFEDRKSLFYKVISGNEHIDAVFAFSSRSVADEIIVGRIAKAFGGYHAQTLVMLMALKKCHLVM